MMKCADPLKLETMQIIKKNLENWRDFIRELGYCDGEIEHLLEETHGDIEEVIYQFLLDWTQSRNQKD